MDAPISSLTNGSPQATPSFHITSRSAEVSQTSQRGRLSSGGSMRGRLSRGGFSSGVFSSSRRPSDAMMRRLSSSLGKDTAFSRKFPMYVLPVREVLAMDRLPLHEDMKARGKLVEWSDGMKAERCCLFLTHSFNVSTLTTLQAQNWRCCVLTGDVKECRRTFASRNCVISTANPCECVRTRRKSVVNPS
eukprot:952145-Prymnesium_polylepis.1